MSNAIDFGTQFRTVQTGGLTIAFNSGQVSSIELPRTLFHKHLALRLSGTLTSTVAGTSNPDENPLNLVRKIEVVGDGVKTLFSVSGKDAFRLGHILMGKAPELTGLNSFAIQGPTPFSAMFFLHNEAIRMGMPVDSYLDPRGFEKLELRVTWGTVADIYVGGTVSINAGCQIDVNIAQTADGEEYIGFRRLLTYDETAIAGVSTQLPINIPRIGFLAGILVHADVDGAASNALINYLTLKSDNVNIHIDKLAWETLRRRNVNDFSLDSVSNAGVVSNAGINGYVYIDLTEDGMISSALNTYGLNTLQMVYDVNAPGSARFIRHTYVFYEPINVG